MVDKALQIAQENLLERRRHLQIALPKSSVKTEVATSVPCEFCGEPRERLSIPGIVLSVAAPCICAAAVKIRQQEEVARQKQEVETASHKQEAHKVASIKKIFSDSMIPERYRDRTFENFQVTAGNHNGYEAAREYASTFPAFPGKEGLMFFGPPGTGKTHLSIAIAIEEMKKGFSVIFGTVPDLLSRIKNSYDSGNRENEHEIMGTLCRASLLILDDLGKEKPTEWVEEKLYAIINTRNAEKRATIITTNVGLKSVEERYPWNGVAIVSRVHEMCKGVILKGADYRRTK